MSVAGEAITHVERPTPPWREVTDTECGLPALNHPTMSRPEFEALVKRLGRQRSSMQVCMTCWHTASRWSDWATDPVQVISRETHGNRIRPTSDDQPSFRDELYAIAALIEEHHDEFAGYLAGLTDTASLEVARKRRMGKVR